jgi:uncharacterized protein YuzE
MQLTRDTKHNVGYVKIVARGKVAYSIEFDKDFVGDFDERDNLVGIELLDAKSYEPSDLQRLMSRAMAEAHRLRGQGGVSAAG